MFTYFKGALVAITPTYVVVEVGGVGYAIYIPCRLHSVLPDLGSTVQLYTSFIVREMSQSLYGFFNIEERDIFEVLLNITGIGPKLSLSLIGHLSLQELQTAVMESDFTTLCRVPGVGKKTAERLVVELKDKLAHFSTDQLSASAANFMIPLSRSTSQRAQDAIMALVNLGYHQNAAQKAIKKTLQDLPDESDLGLLIKAALKNI